MRTPRSYQLSPWSDVESSTYHVISRVVDRQFVLRREEKEQFVRLMRMYEEFCGVRVLTYCVMTNHFHLLVEVPSTPEEGISDELLLERLAIVYSPAYVAQISEWLATARAAGATKEWERLRNKFFYRMWDLSEFMKVLKQRFTQWYNRKHGRCGTLWESRFKSVLVQDGYAARVMAAYIDLNPVRAGMVDDPKDYRWCGYGEAVAGGRAARRGIGKVLESNEGVMGQNAKSQTQLERLEQYRVILFEDGGVIEPEAQLAKATASKAKRLRKGMTEKQVQRVIDKGGKLSRPQMLRCKIRYFSDGVVIGSKSFVDGYFNEKRTQFSHKRKSGARKMRHLVEDKLYALRDLQKKPVG